MASGTQHTPRAPAAHPKSRKKQDVESIIAVSEPSTAAPSSSWSALAEAAAEDPSDWAGPHDESEEQAPVDELRSLHEHLSEDIVSDFLGEMDAASGRAVGLGSLRHGESSQEEGGGPIGATSAASDVEIEFVLNYNALPNLAHMRGEPNVLEHEDPPPTQRVNCMDFDAMGIRYRINSDGEGEIVREPRPRPEAVRAHGPGYYPLPTAVTNMLYRVPQAPGGAPLLQRPRRAGQRAYVSRRVDCVVDFDAVGLLDNLDLDTSSEEGDSEGGGDGTESGDSEGSRDSEGSGSSGSSLGFLDQGHRLSGPPGAALRRVNAA